MNAIFSAPQFRNDDAARAYLESVLWPDGPVCPHCGVINHAFKTKRPGVFRCAEKGCRKDFTVTMKTVMERSHIALHKWLQGFYLMSASKKGMSAHQIHRSLGITYRSAWFMWHRIREAMRAGGLAPLGGEGSVVEIDETAIGRTLDAPKKGRALGGRSGYRNTVLTLVERGGSARSFHIDAASVASMLPIINANVAREAAVMTDEWAAYREIGKDFASHDTVHHGHEEYVRREGKKVVTTNTVEGFYSIFKRGMKGVYQHCGEQHLHRYLVEFDFRYSNRIALGVNDTERTSRAVKGARGKRLTYKQPYSARAI